MVAALIVGGALGGGYAAYTHDAGLSVIAAFALIGAALGFGLSRLRHWED